MLKKGQSKDRYFTRYVHSASEIMGIIINKINKIPSIKLKRHQ